MVALELAGRETPSFHENENGTVPVPTPTPRPRGPRARSAIDGLGSMLARVPMLVPPAFPLSPVRLVLAEPQIFQSVVPAAVRSCGFRLVALPLNPL